MTATATVSALDAATTERLSQGMVRFLETNSAPAGVFADNVFADLSLPQWRVQTDSVEALVEVRRQSHPDLGHVIWRSDATVDGFVFEFQERWTDAQGQEWLAREMLRATVRDGRISEVSIYCTGDWDAQKRAEHAAAVTLIRP